MKNIYWTKLKCQEEALKYSCLSDFRKFSNVAYQRSNKNGWLGDISAHMTRLKPKGYWTKEKCHEDALKYNSKSKFSKNSSTSYSHSLLNGWLDEICSHMIISGNRYKRGIYAYEFEDNSVYVGLTYNFNNRKNRHIKNSKSIVYKKIKDNVPYYFNQVTEYVDIKTARELEEFYINKYKNNDWTILNKSKTGGLGGNILKWTKEKCREEALKYDSISELQKNNQSVYNSARKNHWLDDICSHMRRLHKPKDYWSKERCREEALKCRTRVEFQKKYKSANFYANKNGWMDEICSHMKRLHKPNNYWSKERCREEALKFNTKIEFKKNSSRAYIKSWKENWLDDICSHMIILRKKNKNKDG